MIADFFTDVIYLRVFVGTLVIGCTCGVLGTFTYLRRQSLMADVIGHSSMLGVTLAFLLSVLALRIDGRNMAVILVMSSLVGLCAAGLTSTVAATSRVGTDASMAVVLALTFGGGMALLNEISVRTFPSSASGLKDYIFGRATTLLWADIWVSLGLALVAMTGVALLWRQVLLFVFDPVLARVLGVRVRLVDAALTAATVIAVVIGLKAVGLVLIIAYVVFPAVAARQWTNSCLTMTLLAGGFGAGASVAGAMLSVAHGLASGPTTVLVLTAIAGLSMALAPKRSLLVRAARRRRARAALLSELEGQGLSERRRLEGQGRSEGSRLGEQARPEERRRLGRPERQEQPEEQPEEQRRLGQSQSQGWLEEQARPEGPRQLEEQARPQRQGQLGHLGGQA